MVGKFKELMCALQLTFIISFEELTFKSGDRVNIVGYKDVDNNWHPVCFH